MAVSPADFTHVDLLGLDIDGTLTDGMLFWGGPDIGWTQRFAVRDGEAILRLAACGLPIVPISRNKSLCAKVRMQMLKLPTQWVGVDNKVAAVAQVAAAYRVAPQRMAYVGDGLEDGRVFAEVGLGCCVQDGHPQTQAAAHYVTLKPGGCGAVEEVIDRLMAARSQAT